MWFYLFHSGREIDIYLDVECIRWSDLVPIDFFRTNRWTDGRSTNTANALVPEEAELQFTDQRKVDFRWVSMVRTKTDALCAGVCVFFSF